jgi:uncharacterized protein (DUF1015 family)
MADVLPFRALRYRPEAVGDIAAVLAPPFDVIDSAQRAELEARSPHNIVRIELPNPGGVSTDEPYAAARELLSSWLDDGVLERDERPSFYRYVQEFEHEGHSVRRHALFARVRLEPWDAGSVLPHERTMAAPKRDRIQVMRHVRANISPVFALHRDPGAQVAASLDASKSLARYDCVTADGQHHVLTQCADAASSAAVSALFRGRPLYVADGHHRYETALAYRDERRAQAAQWTGDEPENFVMMALVAAEDPGLIVKAFHRLVRPPSMPTDLLARLAGYFQIDDVTPKSYDGTALLRLLARLQAAGTTGGTAIGALGLEEGRLHLLTLRDIDAARALMPGEHSSAWKTLDVSVLDEVILRAALGVDAEAGAGEVEFTDDAAEAMAQVEAGRWPLAFLLNPTPVEQVLAVADAGDRMPEKSTYFYPKMPTGLVLNPLDD